MDDTEVGKAVVQRFYTIEGYLRREISSEIGSLSDFAIGANGDYEGTSQNRRVETRYEYDAAGNQTSVTRAFGTSQSQTEYSYYDLADRRIALVDATGVLGTFSYDGNGKLESQRRYADPTNGSTGGNLSASSINSAFLTSLGVSPDANRDLITSFAYNELNLLETQTQNVSSAHGGNRTTRYYYDVLGNLTQKVAPGPGAGLATLLNYDAAGRNIQTITPDGAQTFIEYNTFGFKTRTWTGGDPSAAAPAKRPQRPKSLWASLES